MLAKLMSLFLLALVRVLTGAQARWYGCPPKAEQRIYFANHQSHADLVMIWAALPEELRTITRPIAAKESRRTRKETKLSILLGLLLRVFRVIFAPFAYGCPAFKSQGSSASRMRATIVEARLAR